eukprot:TRINITY_DN36078_c0_g1_i1.p1 TRINITY_DN36078_c0_g1~~TRINITY_DN36078_c0_g1_i1.p1  ORF type:complete len:479 (+),score=40.47 TRINITY_DN36078_c0_g1_i1:527-1963(+)
MPRLSILHSIRFLQAKSIPATCTTMDATLQRWVCGQAAFPTLSSVNSTRTSRVFEAHSATLGPATHTYEGNPRHNQILFSIRNESIQSRDWKVGLQRLGLGFGVGRIQMPKYLGRPEIVVMPSFARRCLTRAVATRTEQKRGHRRSSQPKTKAFDEGKVKAKEEEDNLGRRERQKEEEASWSEFDSDVSFMTRTVRLVQWYPGHIAKAERDLKEQLKWVDVVLEVRDARIPQATTHPELDAWIGQRKKMVVLNRVDMVSAADQNAWGMYYRRHNCPTLFTDGQHGAGIHRLTRDALAVGKEINDKRRSKGLLPRPVRAAVIGYPNVGKSALINRLVGRRMCESAPKPGVTKHIKWVQIGENLELLDAPGVLPCRIADQAAAARLAICNDIGEAAYAVAGVASILVEMLRRIPSAGPQVLESRYKMDASSSWESGEDFLELVADKLFNGDVDQASHRVLKDFRKGAFGWLALERPPRET